MTYERKFTRKTFAFAPKLGRAMSTKGVKFGKRQEKPVKQEVLLPTLDERIAAIKSREWRDYLTLCKELSDNLTIWALVRYEKGSSLYQVQQSLDKLFLGINNRD